MPTVHVLQGPDKGHTYIATDGPTIIGRRAGQISLSDHSASRRHAEIRPDNGAWVLRDLNSSNGTFLNGQRIVTPAALKQGDHIRIGGTVLVFGAGGNEPGTPATQPIHDLVDVDLGGASGGSSILASVDASEESVLLEPPETAEAVAAWHVVYRVAAKIGTTASVEAFLEQAADILFRHVVADSLVLLRCGSDHRELTPQVVRFRDTGNVERPTVVTSRTIIKHVLTTCEGVLCANAMTDERFSGESKQDSIHNLGLRSIICVPVVANGQVHGVLHLDSSMSHHTYTEEQLRLVVAIGRLAGMAIQNAKLLESRVQTERLAAAGETVAYLSHHIRNILQGLSGGADVVEMGLKKGDLDTTKSGWALVRRSLDRTYDLAMNMLTFSKSRQPRIEPALISSVVREVIALVQTRADERGVCIHNDLQEIPPIPMDPNGIHQAIHNILVNAIEAAPSRTGRVVVSTCSHADTECAVVSIADNGPGIPSEFVTRMFEAFESTKGQGGTGLGLAAAKKIVDELGGEIRVESVPDEGTTFHIRLPMQPVRMADEDGTATDAPASS